MSVMKASKLLEGLSSKQRAEAEAAIEVHRLNARQGQRLAMVCAHPDCNPRWRQFFSSDADARGARCPDHGPAVRQVNKPYFEVATS